ncbi:head maturation protease, ClpP-related [Magnetococcales bacterium HHB-1]
MGKNWFRMTAENQDVVKVEIYDRIGEYGVSAQAFIDALKETAKTATLNLHINSPGGDVFDGIAIFNVLKRYQGKVNVFIDGIAASMASAIAMAGDDIVMPENTMLMIHDPSAVVMGTAEDMLKTAESLEKTKSSLVTIYRDKTGLDEERIRAMMADETWLTAEEAVKTGFADRVETHVQITASFDLSAFKNTPTCLGPICQVEKKSFKNDSPEEPPEPNFSEEKQGAVLMLEPQPQNAVDLDKIRAEERVKTLNYVAEIHEVCALANQETMASAFIAKETSAVEVRKQLLELRAQTDEATQINPQHGQAASHETTPVIDIEAIYAARNAKEVKTHA